MIKCEIRGGVPLTNPLVLGKALLKQKKVRWFTSETGVTYCLEIPAGIFLECTGSGTCRYEVKDTQYQELRLDTQTMSPGDHYTITVCAGTQPSTCVGGVVIPPEIIVEDNRKKKVKPAEVKKAVVKKKAK